VILASDGAYDGPTTITASAAPTFAELAEIASELSGRTIRYQQIDEQDWIAAQAAAGQPEHMTRFLLGVALPSIQRALHALLPGRAGRLLRRRRSATRRATRPSTAHRAGRAAGNDPIEPTGGLRSFSECRQRGF
jgi:NAD(P)H dehydrogenase (quinone)